MTRDTKAGWLDMNAARSFRKRLHSARDKRLHQMSWEEYVGPDPRVVDDSAWGPVEFAYMEEAESKLISAHALMKKGGVAGIDLPVSEAGLRCIAQRDLVVLMSEDGQDLYGGIFDGTTFVPEKHRGKGYSKHLHLAIDGYHRAFLDPTHFSHGGIAARRAAHREATERAFAAGLDDIHPANLARYLGVEISDLPAPTRRTRGRAHGEDGLSTYELRHHRARISEFEANLGIPYYQMSLEQFAGRGMHLVCPEDYEHQFRDAWRILERTNAQLDLDRNDTIEVEMPDCPARVIVKLGEARNAVLLLSEDLTDLYGGKAGVVPVIAEEMRGRGLSKYLHLAIEGSQRMFGERSGILTEDGYRARCSAHKASVGRALEEGVWCIHPENLERYRDVLPLAEERLAVLRQEPALDGPSL